MKKLLVTLAMLALVMVLTPGQEATAEGKACPGCGQGLIVQPADSNIHDYFCRNDSCEYYNITYGAVYSENHTLDSNCYCSVCEEYCHVETYCSDGVHIPATCKEPGLEINESCWHCSRCGHYVNNKGVSIAGTVIPQDLDAHDWETTLTNGGDTHYYACSRCDAKKDEAAHSYGSWTKVDDETHEGTCVCGAKTTGEHVWNGSHWCGYPRKCSVCQEYYGEILGHEFWYEYKTEEQHKINCYHCDGLFGREDHSGGTATCTQKAVCEKCGEAYGDYAHDWGEWHVDPEDSIKHIRTCKNNCGASESHTISWGAWEKADEENHKHTCQGGCGLSEKVAHVWNGSHWCGYPRKCRDCGEYYGDTLDHEFWYEYKTEEQHKINCYHCDGLFGREDHSGGTATCQAKAKCEKCGQEYGDYAAHDWDTAWTTGDGKHWHKCKTPGCTAKNDEAEHSGGTATCQAKAKCADCGEAYGELAGHDWDTAWTTGDGKHWHKCKTPGCTAKKDEAEHSGGTATCQAKAKCADCGEKYGAALGHDLVHHDAKAPTCTEIGWDAYDTCSRCDYTTYEEKVALGHDYQITSRTITIITSTCRHCGDSAWTYNPSSRSLLDGLVRDVEGEPVDYSAGVSLVDGKRVLTVTPDPVDGEVGLYLTPEEAELWLKQGIDTVSFSTDFAALEIDLSEITAEWFPLEDGAEVEFFVFTLAPAENGAEVRLEALIGEEKTPAEAFTGIALRLEDQEINVTENGVYRKE